MRGETTGIHVLEKVSYLLASFHLVRPLECQTSCFNQSAYTRTVQVLGIGSCSNTFKSLSRVRFYNK